MYWLICRPKIRIRVLINHLFCLTLSQAPKITLFSTAFSSFDDLQSGNFSQSVQWFRFGEAKTIIYYFMLTSAQSSEYFYLLNICTNFAPIVCGSLQDFNVSKIFWKFNWCFKNVICINVGWPKFLMFVKLRWTIYGLCRLCSHYLSEDFSQFNSIVFTVINSTAGIEYWIWKLRCWTMRLLFN